MSNDLIPPRLFNVITSSKVQYNMDTVEYLVSQEEDRRAAGNLPRMSEFEKSEFRRQIISTLIIQGDAEKAVNLRPMTTRKQLNG